MPLLAASAPSNGLVIGLGMGMVFVGLICIIIICYLLGVIINLLQGGKKSDASAENVVTQTASPVQSSPAAIENRQELVAAVSAAIAEELGTDVSAIRIKSIKKL